MHGLHYKVYSLNKFNKCLASLTTTLIDYTNLDLDQLTTVMIGKPI